MYTHKHPHKVQIKRLRSSCDGAKINLIPSKGCCLQPVSSSACSQVCTCVQDQKVLRIEKYSTRFDEEYFALFAFCSVAQALLDMSNNLGHDKWRHALSS